MQLLPRYLLINKINAISNDIGYITEYFTVYARQLTLYKGIDNEIEFKIINADQKPIDITSYTPVLAVFDQNKRLIIEHNCTVNENKKGICTVTISDSDTLNLEKQFLSYNLYLSNAQGNKLTYTDTHFGNNATALLSDYAFPGPFPTTEITSFLQDADSWVTNAFSAEPSKNGNEALHTAAFYNNNFIGNITIQATLEHQITGLTSWANISVVTFTGNETMPVPINFNGVFSYIRFLFSTNPTDSFTKILLRN